jgi:16S rRNA (cytidine1402-2'-O)-methyltransferase
LEDAVEFLGDRRVVVAREMTKVYEEIYRGTITEVLDQLGEQEVKGEVTIILEGGKPQKKVELTTVLEALKYYSQELRLSMKESVGRVSEELGVSRREVYQESLKIREKDKEEIKDPAPRKE